MRGAANVRVAVAAALLAALLPAAALAQDEGQPPPVYAPTPATPPAYAPTPPAPPALVYVEPTRTDVPAPRSAFWVGGRAEILGFDDDFYQNGVGRPETTGNFVRPGLGFEADAGVRFARRFIPYVGFELGLHGAGHRFDGDSSASAYSTFFGLGFRSVWVDIGPEIGFLTDLSLGYRTVTVSANSGKYSMSALELFRLGIGLEIRLSRVFTLSPLLTLSGGAMSNTSGSISFAQTGDGQTHPTYQDGASIDQQRGYLVVSLGCGAHFDLFASYH
jgi:hypothetical protein